MKTDITMYSDAELSLIVFNDEWLYRQRHKHCFLATIDELFIYRPEQMAELEDNLETDLEENAA